MCYVVREIFRISNKTTYDAKSFTDSLWQRMTLETFKSYGTLANTTSLHHN